MVFLKDERKGGARSEDTWGKAPSDLRAKLARQGIHRPEDVTSDVDLATLLGPADAQALRKELGQDSIFH